MLMEVRKFFFSFISMFIYIYVFIRTRQYKLIEGPFPSETVFTGEIGRLKSYEKQKPYVYFYFLSIKIKLFYFIIDHLIFVIHI